MLLVLPMQPLPLAHLALQLGPLALGVGPLEQDVKPLLYALEPLVQVSIYYDAPSIYATDQITVKCCESGSGTTIADSSW